MTTKSRKHKFTATLCAKLEGPAKGSSTKEIEYSDTEVPRLKFYVTVTDKRGWRWRFQNGEEKRAIRIGDFPGISVEEARKTAREMGAALDRGEDPAHPRDERKAMPTFREFAMDEYLPHARQYKKSAHEDESKLRLHLLPVFGDKKLGAISRYDVEMYRGNVAKSHCNATSNRHMALLSKIFNQAIHWERTDRNPCTGIKKLPEKTEVGKDFKPEQMQRLLAAFDSEPNQKAATALRLLTFTGLRLREVLHLTWDRVNLEEGRIYLDVTKAGKPRFVAINSVACEILAGIERHPTSPYVLPGMTDPMKPLHNINKAWHRALEKAKLGHARIHDLRHQFATAGVRAGLSLYSIGGLLGHAPGSTVTTRYAHIADDVMRKASEQTAAALLGRAG